MKVLVIASHPDDEILGGGATFAKHVDAGDEVHAVVLSEGASSRYDQSMVKELQNTARASAEIIGFASIVTHDLPDQRLDASPLIETTQLVESVVFDMQPDVIYTHSHVDVNSDHGVVARAVWTACRPYSTPWLRSIRAFETPSSTEWAMATAESAFLPQYFVDVTSTIERKLKAMERYESELRQYPHPRSIQALRERASYWGSKVGVGYAEPFVLLREMA